MWLPSFCSPFVHRSILYLIKLGQQLWWRPIYYLKCYVYCPEWNIKTSAQLTKTHSISKVEVVAFTLMVNYHHFCMTLRVGTRGIWELPEYGHTSKAIFLVLWSFLHGVCVYTYVTWFSNSFLSLQMLLQYDYDYLPLCGQFVSTSIIVCLSHHLRVCTLQKGCINL